MRDHCCMEETILTDPCAALLSGDLNYGNFVTYGFTPWSFALLIAQCGTTDAVEDLTLVAEQILACCDASLLILQDIDDNTDGLETQMTTLIALVTAGNATRDDILVAVDAILVEAIAINANTDGLEAMLASIVTILNSIDSNTDGLEACCAASNIILADILLEMQDPTALGAHVPSSGTQAIPMAGSFASWTIVRTNGIGTLNVDGLTVVNLGDATGDEAQPQRTVPAPVIIIAGGALYEWKAKT